MSAQEGDAQAVDVQPGATARVTLTAKGSSHITGRVVEYGSNLPVPGLACHALMRSGAQIGVTNWSLEAAPKTDANGDLSIEQAPAGEVAVECVGNPSTISSATAMLVTKPGETATAALEVVRRRFAGVGGYVGLSFRSGVAGPLVHWVQRGGSAALAGVTAGELVLAIDGVSVQRLNPSGLDMLILNHVPGTFLTLTTVSGQKTVTRKLLCEAI